jgi:hypothetical protein
MAKGKQEDMDVINHMCEFADAIMPDFSDDEIRYFIENLKRIKRLKSEKDCRAYWTARISQMRDIIKERHKNEKK